MGSPISKPDRPSVLAFPMHGHQKMLYEGYRTRDGHLVEWLGRAFAGAGSVHVLSRPEPLAKRAVDATRFRYRAKEPANTTYGDKTLLKLPSLENRYQWWIDSAQHFSELPRNWVGVPAIVWNPFIGVSNVSESVFSNTRTTVFDLLDDWTVHYSFQSIRREVDEAYRRTFDQATFVTANSEGTVSLAKRYGRDDVVLLTNGCDPERFSSTSTATGPITVGYVGKIGNRVDSDLVATVAKALPHLEFVFAGPILDGDFRQVVASLPNVVLLGDVHYDRLPELLQTFDIGWVPHATGAREVGGDVIKTYEYSAAGLTVLSTPIAGVSDRGLSDVYVLPATDHAQWLSSFTAGRKRIKHVDHVIPDESTWRTKAELISSMLRVPRPDDQLGNAATAEGGFEGMN
jgi:glycosyltransferase involved in cell wall biosynthesis